MSSRGGLTILVVVFYCLCATAAFKFPALEHIKPSVSDEAQSEAVSGLLKRLLGDRSEEFLVTVNRSLSNHSLDVCELRSGRNNRIVATGSSGVAVASGIYNYIKYFCNCHVSWSGDQLALPRPLPKLTGVLRINTPHRFVCLSGSEMSPVMGLTGSCEGFKKASMRVFVFLCFTMHVCVCRYAHINMCIHTHM